MPRKKQSFVDENGRVCLGCQEYLTWDHFRKTPFNKTHYMARCKKCEKERAYNLNKKRKSAIDDRYDNLYSLGRL